MQKTIVIVLLLFASLCSAQFVVQNTPATNFLTSISSPTNSVAWACGDSLQLIRTSNGGANWVNARGNIPGMLRFFNIWGVDSLTAHVCVSDYFFTIGSIYKTTDGGVNWTRTFYQGGNGFINAVAFTTPLNGFAMGDPVGGRWTLLKTTNGGANWDSTGMYLPSLSGEVGLDRSLFYEGSKIWFGSQSGKIYSSTNNGLNWITTQTVMSGVQAIFFNDAASGKGLAVSNWSHNEFTMIKTSNSINWSAIDLIKNERIPSVSGLIGTSNYWFIYPTSILKSSNYGLNWDLVFNNTLSSLHDICVSRSGTLPRSVYACRHNGSIVKGNTDISSGINLISNNIPERFELKQNYPNPFNPTTKIIFNLRNSGNISLKVYNQSGQLIIELLNEFKTAGSYSVDFNGKDLPSGVYYYKMESEINIETNKMILIK